MSCSRREFFSGASAFALGAGRLFAAPPGWKPTKKPKLVLGVISGARGSDTIGGVRVVE